MNKADTVKEILELQRKVDRAARTYQLDIWMSLPLSMGQLKSLFFISNEGSTNSRRLAESLGVTPTNVTGIVDRLVKQGLVSRSEDGKDRRVLVLKATRAGEAMVARLRERKRKGFSAALSRMDDKELAMLHEGLAALVRAIET